MPVPKISKNLFTIVLTALVVAACGGGGGGTSSGSTVPTAGVSITTANAKTVSAATLDSIDTVQGATSGADFLPAVSINGQPGSFNYPDFFTRQLDRFSVVESMSSGNVSGVAISGVDNCSGGGTVSVSGNIFTTGSLTAGDTISLVFNNCIHLGDVANGSMSMTITQISPGYDGNPPYTLGINVVLSGFSVNASGFVITSNGDLAMLTDEDLSDNINMILSGTSLTATAGGQSEMLRNYRYEIMANLIGGPFSFSLQGTFASTRINGAISYSTITPFTGNDLVGTGEATIGELHITTSADNSQAWLIAQPDGINVQIDIDLDGDNTVDNTVMTTWTELYSL
ncbi:MAG: hypothetical protein KZQ80_02450 [Candidatus Thiodiazotropha sp. (ex Monitilora ramsayi)]|nr:hypothetical protein [Candidatus Thiodiazotropha sp. (ex Monitilora ramsayi)]